MWIAPVDKLTLEENLFHFLLSVADGHPKAIQLLLVENETLQQLYEKPHPDLLKALHHCLDAFLIELTPNPAGWGKLNVPVFTLGLALAVHNCLVPEIPLQSLVQENKQDPVINFTRALIETIEPANKLDAALAFHGVLRGCETFISNLSPNRARMLFTIIEHSPLTALWVLDKHTPAAVDKIGAELLPGWRNINSGLQKISVDKWLAIVTQLLTDERIARFVRQRWLVLPETYLSCRNIGLLLELLRHQGGQRDFILEFYEAYDYFCAKTRTAAWQEQARFWPVLETIEKLLRATGDHKAIIQLNRRGSEYFLKFLPLVQIIIAEAGMPTEYDKLSPAFIATLRHLLNYVAYKNDQRISFGEIEFAE